MSTKLNQTRSADSPEVSRLHMDSVQTARSTQPHRARVSSACLGVTATAADLASWFWSIVHPLSCVPSLQGRYPLRRYYRRSDCRRAALRAVLGHEHRLSPTGLPDSCGRTADHSVSNHPRADRGSPGCQWVLPTVTGFVFRSQTRPATPTESSSQRLPTPEAWVTDWSFSFRCSPPRVATTQLRFDTARLLAAQERTSTALFSRPLRRTSAKRLVLVGFRSAPDRRRSRATCRW